RRARLRPHTGALAGACWCCRLRCEIDCPRAEQPGGLPSCLTCAWHRLQLLPVFLYYRRRLRARGAWKLEHMWH
ncbi:unnamed protein product, partial [Amoebophrya sp. A120]